MKKIITTLSVLSLILTLSSCNSNQTTTKNNGSENASKIQEDPKIKKLYKLENQNTSFDNLSYPSDKIDAKVKEFINKLGVTFDKKVVNNQTLYLLNGTESNWNKFKGNIYIGDYLSDYLNGKDNIILTINNKKVFLNNDKVTIDKTDDEKLTTRLKGKNIIDLFNEQLAK